MTSGPVSVVFNPTGLLTERTVRTALAAAGLNDLRWAETTPGEPGTAQARQAVEEGASLVVVCGGDGTVMAVVSAVAGTGVPLAVLPGGTGNLLARNYGVPLGVGAAARVAASGHRRSVDVGAFGDARFAVMAGIGFDAALMHNAPDALKRWLGWAAYVVSAVRMLRHSPLVHFELRLDDGEPFQRRGRGVLVANVGRLQAGLHVLPRATGDDGLFEVGLLAPHRLRDWAGLVWRVSRKQEPHRGQLERWSAARVEVHADRPLLVELDGDVRGERRDLVAHVLPRALVLCVPLET